MRSPVSFRDNYKLKKPTNINPNDPFIVRL